MSGWSTLKEILAPGSVRHTVAPPLEAGLRPNGRLQDGTVVAELGRLAVDDIAVWGGRLVVSTRRALLDLTVLDAGAQAPAVLAEFEGDAGALAVLPGGLAVAVEGVGILQVADDGGILVIADDPRLHHGVTALCALPDGRLLAAVGSTRYTEWERALMLRDASGLLLRVARDGTVEELDRGIAWPSGVAVEPEGTLLLSVANEHVVQRRQADGSRASGQLVLTNLPGYPGRLTRAGDGSWWAAMPCLRSRATELMFEFPEMVEEMVTTTEVDSWLVPRLRIEVPHRAPLQVGELSVLGQIKPWAPTRTYGLVFRFAGSGQIVESAHSRADGDRHGVTGVAVHEDRVAIAVRGAGCVVEVEQEGAR